MLMHCVWVGGVLPRGAYRRRMVSGARSYKNQQVSRDELLALLARSKVDSTRARIAEALDEVEGYTSDILVVTGDLHVPGTLDCMHDGAFLLVVDGNLVVDGCYHDYDDPESFLIVTGNMRARDVVTAGWLEVHGDLETGNLIGDYNDCSGFIGGNVRAALFYGEEHHFTIGGVLQAGIVVGRPRLAIATQPVGIPLTDARLLEHIDRALLRVFEDSDDDGTPILELDGIADFRALKRRVSEGIPLHAL
jgi:hypothetical protein